MAEVMSGNKENNKLKEELSKTKFFLSFIPRSF